MGYGHLNPCAILFVLMQNRLDTFRVLLVCHVSSKIGIGHLSRLLALAQELRKTNYIKAEFLIFGDVFKKDELSGFDVYSRSIESDFTVAVEEMLQINDFDALIFDLYPKHNINNPDEFFMRLKQRDICLVGIDSLLEHCNIFDLLWIPSFNFDCGNYNECSSLLRSGWDSFLIQKRLPHKDWIGGSKVLVLTGGSDVSGLGEILPAELDGLLDKDVEVHWVRGPFSTAPYLPKICRLTWVVHDAPERLDELIVQSNYVLTVFGVSFFEVLQYGIPTVVFSPYSLKDNDELLALSKEGVAMVAGGCKDPVESLAELMSNNELSKNYSMNALNKMSINGAESLSKEIYSLIGSK